MQPRYIFVDGVMKTNPDWSNSQHHSSHHRQNEALAVVSSTEEMMLASELQREQLGSDMVTVETTVHSMTTYQSPQYLTRFGVQNQNLDGGSMLDQLGKVFAKYEIPIGMISKLMDLSEYHLNFIIDDSGSMGSETDLKFKQASSYFKKELKNSDQPYDRNEFMTRWQEAEDRLHILIEILKFVPFKSLNITFLNDEEHLELSHYGKTPGDFAKDAHRQIRSAFSRIDCRYGTPIYTKLNEAFHQANEPTMHYLFTDGVPSDRSEKEVANLVKHRPTPAMNPLTFVTCTEDDDEIEWAKKIEGKADFVAELDDFKSEKKEVLKRQGRAFPFSRGFWLLSHLVGAINPYDLDALDEKAPLTKGTLNELMGRKLTEEDYRYYFNKHPQAGRYAEQYHQFAREDIVARQITHPREYLLQPYRLSVNSFQSRPATVGSMGQFAQPQSYGQQSYQQAPTGPGSYMPNFS